MIDITTSQEVSEIIKNIDMNKSLLIMGKAESDNHVNSIKYFDTVEAVRSVYGESKLTNAFATSKSFRVPHVFLINVQHPHDYIEIANILRHYDFAYITSTDIYLTDGFFDSTRNNKKITYYQHFLERISPYNRSVIVATDKHASLYEDIDAYLDEMISVVGKFKNEIRGSMDGRNICFVANNLELHPLSNIVLASILCQGDLEIYPASKRLGKAIFDIDAHDTKDSEVIYFKNNHLTGTTIENLLNLSRKTGPDKILTIDRIIKYIKRNLDLSRFSGRQMSTYQKLRVEKALIEYFDSLVNWILRSYKIKSIQFIKESAGAGIIVCDIDIWTINSIEKFSVVVEG